MLDPNPHRRPRRPHSHPRRRQRTRRQCHGRRWRSLGRRRSRLRNSRGGSFSGRRPGPAARGTCRSTSRSPCPSTSGACPTLRARARVQSARLHHLSTPPPPQARDCGLGRGGGHAEGRHGMGDDLADSPRQGAGFLVREQGLHQAPCVQVVQDHRAMQGEAVGDAGLRGGACADLAQGGQGPTRDDNRVQPGLLHAGTCARSCPPSPLLTIVSVLL